MKYVRDQFHYFRESDKRIENTSEINKLAKEQTDLEFSEGRENGFNPMFAVISILVIIVIIGLIYAGYVAINSIGSADELFENPAVIYGFLGVFMLVGCIFTFIPLGKVIFLKIKCKEEAQAKCIGFDDKVVVNRHSSYVMTCPVYRFNVNGQDYTVCDGKYFESWNESHIGEQVPVVFDPNNPNNCIINGKSYWNIYSILLGSFFIIASIVIVIAMLS